jgi:DNA-binding LytR/AlgR family response regulator
VVRGIHAPPGGRIVIRIAVVEDDDRNRALLVEHLRRYEQEHGLAFEVTTFSDGREILARFRPVYDIVLLDIQMEHVDGMTTAKRIREVDKDVVLVFITNSPQYAIVGYQVAALSYLLKPVPYFAFSEELARCLDQVRKRERGFVMLTTGSTASTSRTSSTSRASSTGSSCMRRTGSTRSSARSRPWSRSSPTRTSSAATTATSSTCST